MSRSQAACVETAQLCDTEDWIFLAAYLELTGSLAVSIVSSMGTWLLRPQHTGWEPRILIALGKYLGPGSHGACKTSPASTSQITLRRLSQLYWIRL